MKRFLSRLLDELATGIAKKLMTTPAGRPTTAGYETVPEREESPIDWFVDALEWELVAEPIEADVERVGTTQGDFGTVTIRRDDEYRIDVSLDAVGAAPWADAHLLGIPGSFSEGIEIAAQTRRLRPLVLPRAHPSSTSRNWVHGQPATRIGIHADEVVRTDIEERKPVLLVDWFIAGPKDHTGIIFRRVTERQEASSFSRIRYGLSRGTVEHRIASAPPPAGVSHHMSNDYIVLDVLGGPVRVSLVPKDKAPDWTNPLAIEFPVREEEPSDDLRYGVAEALGFIFGRHILHVGTTTFDDAGVAVRERALSPWGRDVTETARRHDAPVTPLFDWAKGSLAEAVMTPIVSAFLAAREEFNLSHVIWTMWVAQRMPMTMDTALYASALEALMRGWFASTRSKTKAVYMPTKDFRKVFAEGIAKFEATAKEVEYGDRIARKIGRANEMGVNERFEVFFEELGLPVGAGEDAVVRSRNISAHGGKSDRPHQDLVMLGAGYRTLLNRVILKVLGFKGEYIDYSVVGRPVRGIDEPIAFQPMG